MAGAPTITVRVELDYERVAKAFEVRRGAWAAEIGEIIARAPKRGPVRPEVPDNGSRLVQSYTARLRDGTTIRLPAHCVAGPRCECPDAVHDEERAAIRAARPDRKALERQARRAAALLAEVRAHKRGVIRPPTARDMIGLTHRCDCSTPTRSAARVWIPRSMRPELENGVAGAAAWQVNAEITRLWKQRQAEAARRAQTLLARDWPVCGLHGPLELTWWRSGQWMARGWWVCRGGGRR